MKLSAPIVGAAFRPPAPSVLSRLPFGQALLCRRQPENPHDPQAVQVLLEDFKPVSQGGSSLLGGLFFDMSERAIPDEFEAGRGMWNKSALTDPLPLGYISAKTGEASQWSQILDHNQVSELRGSLGGDLSGKPTVEVDISELNIPEGLKEEEPR